MNEKSYEEWAWNVTLGGIACGLNGPIEALINAIRSDWQIMREMNREYIMKYMIQVTSNYFCRDCSIEEAIDHFNDHYKDNRFDFSEFIW